MWDPLSWDCDDEEVGLHASVVLSRCVGESQYKTGCKYHSACDENVQAQDCQAHKQNVCHEVSWLRESGGRCLKLASICVQEIRVEEDAQVFSRYEKRCDESPQLWRKLQNIWSMPYHIISWQHARVDSNREEEGRSSQSPRDGRSCPEHIHCRHNCV